MALLTKKAGVLWGGEGRGHAESLRTLLRVREIQHRLTFWAGDIPAAFPVSCLRRLSKMIPTISTNDGSSSMNLPLKTVDPEIYRLIQREKMRQFSGLELIASEVRFG